MDTTQATATEPPSSTLVQASYPIQAFGYGTVRYRSFLQALLDGLLEYEARKGGATHGATPLPAA